MTGNINVDKLEHKVDFQLFINRNLRPLVLIGITILISIIITIIRPVFITPGNLLNIVRQTSILAVVCIGMTFVILTGGIDISVGSNIAFAGAFGVYVLNKTGNPFLGMLVSIIFGIAIGALNGIMIGKFKISCFMATIGTMILARGLAISFTNADSVEVSNKVFVWLGQASVGQVPVILFAMVVLYVLMSNVLSRTVFGRDTYAVGSNILAARATGRKVNIVILYVYVLCGLMVGIGSIITVGRLGSAQPWAGLGLEFEVITAVVLGGTSLAGGEGNLKGTFMGALLVGVIGNGLGLMNVGPFYLSIIRGIILLIAVLIDAFIARFRTSYRKPVIKSS